MHLLERFTHCPVCGSAQFVESSLKSKHCRSCGFEYFLNPSAAVAAIILNEKEELLVVKRNSEPARGTLDLPGGFCDTNETLGQAVGREVKEETGLTVNRVEFLFSLPNTYRYSGFDVPTLDSFFLCSVESIAPLRAADDAADARWVPLNEINPLQFGLQSIRKAVTVFIERKADVR